MHPPYDRSDISISGIISTKPLRKKVLNLRLTGLTAISGQFGVEIPRSLAAPSSTNQELF